MLLIDGSNLLHRCLHTEVANLQDNRGRFTGGAHGFLSMISSAVRKHSLKHSVIVAWDLGIPLFRRRLYSEYKPNKMPIGSVNETLLSEMNKLGKEGDEAKDEWLDKYLMSRRLLHGQFLPLSGCLSIQVENCEADDIIAFVCRKLKDKEIIIFSSDMDLVQCLSKDIIFYDGNKDETIDVDNLITKHNLVRENWRYHWLLTRAICGDNSDGIPGFCGFETAKKYSDQLIYLESESGGCLNFEDALKSLGRPHGARIAGYEKLKSGKDDVLRNYNLMNLEYPFYKNDPIIDNIKKEIASAFIYDIDQHGLESQLHDLGMFKAKVFADYIVQSNRQDETKNYLRELAK